MQWDAGRGPDEKDGIKKFSPHLWFPGGLQSTCLKVFHDIVHNMETGGIQYHHERLWDMYTVWRPPSGNQRCGADILMMSVSSGPTETIFWMNFTGTSTGRPSIQFTWKKESEGKIVFLDVQGRRMDYTCWCKSSKRRHKRTVTTILLQPPIHDNLKGASSNVWDRADMVWLEEQRW